MQILQKRTQPCLLTPACHHAAHSSFQQLHIGKNRANLHGATDQLTGAMQRCLVPWVYHEDWPRPTPGFRVGTHGGFLPATVVTLSKKGWIDFPQIHDQLWGATWTIPGPSPWPALASGPSDGNQQADCKVSRKVEAFPMAAQGCWEVHPAGLEEGKLCNTWGPSIGKYENMILYMFTCVWAGNPHMDWSHLSKKYAKSSPSKCW